MTFCEAYELFGRDSAAIAEACGLDECDAYNLMAARADRDLGIMPMPSAKIKEEDRAEQKRRWRVKNKERLAELRREARI
jgi:hypothetical protein